MSYSEKKDRQETECKLRKADVALPLESSRKERQPSKPQNKNKTRCTYMEKVSAADQHVLGDSWLRRLLEKGPREHGSTLQEE